MSPDDIQTGEGEVVRDSRAARLHRETLVEMNAAVYLARRDAAHGYVLSVLRREVLSTPKDARATLYRFCARLLDEAIESTQRSQMQADSPVLHYLSLLRDTLAAILALVKHEMTLAWESEELAKTLTEYAGAQLRAPDSVFSDSEMNILDCVEDLVVFGEPVMSQATQARMTDMSDDDRRRYTTAFSECRSHYERLKQAAMQDAAGAQT
jgi:hypothetical protein